MQEARGVLDAAEWARAERFRVAPARDEFVAARCLLRRLVGSVTGREPAAVGFGIGTHGKPYLLDAAGVEFNVSHSKGVILIGISRAGAVGVDVEAVDGALVPPGELLDLARASLLPEDIVQVEREGSEDGRLQAFCGFWTRKEAVAKADGRGIGVPLAYDFVEAEGRDGCWITLKEAAEDGRDRYFVSSPLIGTGYLAAVATLHEPHNYELFDAAGL
jgi:4'-phosphopantetheinyl transferase